MLDQDDRKPPKRVRITGLQEAQVGRLLELDAACAGQYHEVGFDAAEVPVRQASDLARFARAHSVKVAEADDVPAGILGWRDEAPGVACIADLQVAPAYQRFGIASRLVEAMFEEANGLGLRHVVARCWQRAPWAMAFYARRGFKPISLDAPPKVVAWADEDGGAPQTRPGEVALWAEIPRRAGEEDLDEEERPSEA